MQGAAGIAAFLLRLAAHLHADDWHITWPDSPFSTAPATKGLSGTAEVATS